MYSTCYHCLGRLGRNRAVAAFPVGCRLAFDAARGRLWAVCVRCGRWNLAPIDEAWEAADVCERVFRGAARRYSTANIGLAQLADGTELVRIGPAHGPELAAWRYGGRLLQTRRRRGRALYLAATACAAGAARVRRLAAGAGPGVTPEETGLRFVLAGEGRRAERVVDVVRPNGWGAAGSAAPGGPADLAVAPIRRRHLAGAMLVRPDHGGHWQLEILHEGGLVRLSGAPGVRTAARLLAAVNAHGVTPDAVAAAFRKLEEAADPAGYFNRVLQVAWRARWGRTDAAPPPASGAGAPAAAGAGAAGPLAVSLTGRAFWGHGGIGSAERQLLLRTPLVDRLALEMAAHEDAERAALAASLATLEAAWREAEELAAIVDGL